MDYLPTIPNEVVYGVGGAVLALWGIRALCRGNTDGIVTLPLGGIALAVLQLGNGVARVPKAAAGALLAAVEQLLGAIQSGLTGFGLGDITSPVIGGATRLVQQLRQWLSGAAGTVLVVVIGGYLILRLIR